VKGYVWNANENGTTDSIHVYVSFLQFTVMMEFYDIWYEQNLYRFFQIPYNIPPIDKYMNTVACLWLSEHTLVDVL
jgi:hypothetical protein